MCAAALALSGCMSDFGSGMVPGDLMQSDIVTRFRTPDASQAIKPTSVSYTHLTLPTICSV